MKPEAPLEIERKYLIAYPDVQALLCVPGCTVSRITQTYLLTDDDSEMRVRRREQNAAVRYVKTVKRAVSPLVREEYEESISEDAYHALLALADPARRPIEKTRICLPVGTLVWEIDLYPFWMDRAVAEVELPAAGYAVVFPPQLRVLREVTDDPAYKNSALALHHPE